MNKSEWFTGGNDGRHQIAVRQWFDRRLSRVECGTVDVIGRAANIVTAAQTARRSVATASAASARGASAASAAVRLVRRRRETVTGRRVGAHITAITGIPSNKKI